MTNPVAIAVTAAVLLLAVVGLAAVLNQPAQGPDPAAAAAPVDDPVVVEDCQAAAKVYANYGFAPSTAEKMTSYKRMVGESFVTMRISGPAWELSSENVAACWRAHFDYFRYEDVVTFSIPTQPEERG